MNKRQKLVQEQFLNNEEAVISRLRYIYDRSANDVNEAIRNLEFQIGDLTEQYDWLDADDPQREIIKSRIQSKIYQKQYQEQLKRQLDGILDKIGTESYLNIADYLDGCYTDGFIGTIFDAHGQGVPIIAPIDQQAMVRAVQLDSKISKGLYTRLGEDVDVLKKRIAAQLSRSIATGKSYAQTAQLLAGETRIGFNNAVRIARTEGHRVQTTAAMDAMEAAKDKGADVLKQWDATLDARTRESHALVDGEIRELDKPFSNGLDFPGDPSGGAAEVINCRCAILQRARWALDEDELQTLQERAKYYGLDKSDEFEDFKKKYLQAVEAPDTTIPVQQTHNSVTEENFKKLTQLGDDEFSEELFDIFNSKYSQDYMSNSPFQHLLDALEEDNLPTVVSSDEFIRMASTDGSQVLFRGVTGDMEKIRNQLLYDRKTAVGSGIFGDGLYFTDMREKAIKYAGGDSDNIFEILISHDAKVISMEDAEKLLFAYREKYPKLSYQLDMATVVRLEGYDVIRIPYFGGETYYNVVNRSKLILPSA